MCKNSFKILIIDDNKELTNNIKDVLEEKNYIVQFAYKALTAIKICKKEKFDLILMDFKLPDMDGLTLHEKLSELISAEYIIITGYGTLESAAKAVTKKNIVGYEIKPIDMGHLLSLVNQIKEKKDAEKSLKELEEKYRTIVDNSFEGIFIIQKEIIKFCNNSFAKIFNYNKPKDIIGMNIKELTSNKSLTLLKKEINDIETDIKAHSKFDFIALKKGGIEIDLETSCNQINFNSNIAVLGFIRDISNEKKLTLELQQAQKMEALGRLAGGIAHDFNNLATVIIGNAEIAKMSLTPKDLIFNDIEEIQKAANRASDLTRQLLAFSRKQKFELKIIDLNMILTNMDKMLKRFIGENIKLITDLQKNLWKIKIDQNQIEQVIINLIINAKDAMPKGGKLIIKTQNIEDFNGIVKETSNIELNSKYVMISISDNGSGIPEEYQSKIFEPFFTTKDIGKGTGLGLSTVYGIIKQSKGYIKLKSEINKGSTFSIYLPAIEEEFNKENIEIEINQKLKGNETILIVEDEDSVRNLLVKLLKNYGYNIIEANNGKKALEICKSNSKRINLILTDVLMPEVDGVELANKLKITYKDIKIIYMSGYTPDNIAKEAYSKKEINYIQKPFIPQIILTKIRKILDSK